MERETSEQPINKTAPTTVYYDGSCPLCSVEIRHYKSREGAENIRFVDASDGEADLGSDLSQDAAMKRFHVRRPDGTLESGARGFAAVWDVLPSWRWVSRIGRLPGVMPVLELAYRGFLPFRPMLSRMSRKLGAKPEGQK